MDDWHLLGDVDPTGVGPLVVPVPGTDAQVLLVRSEDGALHATATACPHQGQPLTDATVEGRVLECSHHAYRYALDGGVCVGGPNPLAGRLTVHELREGPDGLAVRLRPAPPRDAAG